MGCRITPIKIFIEKSRQYPYNNIIAIASIIAGYLFLLLMDCALHHEYKTICPFKLITGIPCPGCGMGRASLALLHGHIGESLYYNILCIPFTAAISISTIWLIRDLITKKNSFFSYIKQPLDRKWKFLLLFLILSTWILNIYHEI